jgi:hypothetical protein
LLIKGSVTGSSYALLQCVIASPSDDTDQSMTNIPAIDLRMPATQHRYERIYRYGVRCGRTVISTGQQVAGEVRT